MQTHSKPPNANQKQALANQERLHLGRVQEAEMASKRLRGSSWEYIVKRAGVLEKPLTFTFQDEGEGDRYVERLEKLLDRGIVPSEHRLRARVTTINHLATQYLHEAHVSPNDVERLASIIKDHGSTPWALVDANWVDDWVTDMKRTYKLSPASIRAKVGALARCADWGIRKKLLDLPDSPLRTLPKGYAQYTSVDGALAGGRRSDESRDRRLEPGEEQRILALLEEGVLPRAHHDFKLPHPHETRVLFRLALETAMRMREMYTLSGTQVSIRDRTVYLDKTKNGDKRQVPLSSVAVELLRPHEGVREMIFPWLDEHGGRLKETTIYVSKLFADVFESAGCPDLRFHDLRHEATSRLFERTSLSTEEIMKITGHRTHSMVMRYLKLRASTLADKLW